MRVRSERGAASIAETVLVAPALLLALMMIVQFGLFFHARNVAETAAQEGVAEARAFDGSAATAETTTYEFLNELGPKMFTGRTVAVKRDQATASVTVTGTVISLVPGLKLEVQESAAGPVEKYVAPTFQGPKP